MKVISFLTVPSTIVVEMLPRGDLLLMVKSWSEISQCALQDDVSSKAAQI